MNNISWEHIFGEMESVFIVMLLITLTYFTLLFLTLALAKIKQRNQRLRLELIKNPKPREKTALERVEERNIIIENRRRLKR